MSLKGTEITGEMIAAANLYSEAKSTGKYDGQRFSGKVPLEPGFVAYLATECVKARGQADSEAGRKRAAKKQRNVLATICAALLISLIFLVIAGARKAEALEEKNSLLITEIQSLEESLVQEQDGPPYTRTELLLREKLWDKWPYIASSKSDKYHVRSCEYADAISQDNRVYYKTEEEAVRDLKTPCSVCRP